ncbi:MAG: alpha/beta fold hydrolase [Kiritimatiellae bacterium]|nr:alpha/beta fold hydrolase [Kiritimatiellia bacterium]
MKRGPFQLPGVLVSIPAAWAMSLDGFWYSGPRRNRVLVIFQHGMNSNFCSGALKKELMQRSGRNGFDFLSVNNSGHDKHTVDERFTACVRDLDAITAFARGKGYRQFVLIGHSTGCQKVTYYQSRRQNGAVRAVVLMAPTDDGAVARRELGARYARELSRARALVAAGRGATLLHSGGFSFSARRFLSAADPVQTEAGLFHYAGPMRHFRRLRCPVLALFGSEEGYACMPVARMGEILRRKTRAEPFAFQIVPGADHSFHGREAQTAARIYRWLRRVCEA